MLINYGTILKLLGDVEGRKLYNWLRTYYQDKVRRIQGKVHYDLDITIDIVSKAYNNNLKKPSGVRKYIPALKGLRNDINYS